MGAIWFWCNSTSTVSLFGDFWGGVLSKWLIKPYITKNINRSNRKTWPLITIFVTSFSLKGKRMTKVVVKSHAFLLDHIYNVLFSSILPGVSWMNYFLVGFTLLPFLLLLSIKMEYNRSNMDQRQQVSNTEPQDLAIS